MRCFAILPSLRCSGFGYMLRFNTVTTLKVWCDTSKDNARFIFLWGQALVCCV
jgi:hypothetical protein